MGEDGALLVRPDKHIGWRSMSLPADPQRALHAALAALLDAGGRRVRSPGRGRCGSMGDEEGG